MTTEEQARKLMVQERQHENHVHENMLNRAVDAGESLPENITEQARELLTKERQDDKHSHESLLNRAGETLIQ